MNTQRTIIIALGLCLMLLFQSCGDELDANDYIEITLDYSYPYYHFEKGVFSRDSIPEDIDRMGISYVAWCTPTPTLRGRMEPTEAYSFNELKVPPKGDYLSHHANAITLNKVIVLKLENDKYAMVRIVEDSYDRDSHPCKHVFKIQINYAAFPNYKETDITTKPVIGTFTDPRDNHTYRTVKIGKQTWMAENLAYIPQITSEKIFSNTEKLFYVYGYKDDSDNTYLGNKEKYGVLYNWPAATDACPSGWHLPTDEEWNELAEFIRNDNGEIEREFNSWPEIGKYLKAETGWPLGFGGTNKYGFSALPGGFLNWNGEYYELGQESIFWTSTIDTSAEYLAKTKKMGEVNLLSTFTSSFSLGYSVRCIKNQ